MASLSDLLAGLDGARVASGDARLEIAEVRDDSRQVGAGDLFVAVPGTKDDGRRFIEAALARGAVAILTEGEPPAGIPAGVAVVLVPSVRRALARLAVKRFPLARPLALTGVTGTNGKTTTTYLVEAILAAAGRPTGVIGTVGYGFDGQVKKAALTTPGATLPNAIPPTMHNPTHTVKYRSNLFVSFRM